jgi:DNA-binding XRE family transcriptional regulator
MSDGQLAERIGISRQAVNSIINGQSDPHLSRLHEIANALNVRVRDLFV